MILVRIPSTRELEIIELKARLRDLVHTRDLKYPKRQSPGRASIDVLITKLVTQIAKLEP